MGIATRRLGYLHLAAIAGVMVATVHPAGATTYCTVRHTADGFVALRAAPDAASRLIVRMRPGEEVLLAEGRQGAWQRAYLMRRNSRGEDGGFERTNPLGWVHAALIRDCY